jgi:hypothetical protein
VFYALAWFLNEIKIAMGYCFLLAFLRNKFFLENLIGLRSKYKSKVLEHKIIKFILILNLPFIILASAKALSF